MRNHFRRWAGGAWLLLTVFWGAAQPGYGQPAGSPAVAHLRQQLRAARHDTTRARLLIAITEEASVNHPDTIAALCRRVLALADGRLHSATPPAPAEWRAWRRLQAAAYNNLGFAANNRGQSTLALGYYQQTLRIYQQIRDQPGLVEAYHNLAVLYSDAGALAPALYALDRGLRLATTLDDSIWVAAYHRTFGTVYADLGETDRARRHLRRSLRLFRDVGDQNGQANAALELADTYKSARPDTAAFLLRQALALARTMDDELLIGAVQVVRGELALARGHPDSAATCFHEALRIQQAQDNTGNLAVTLAGLGAVAAARQQWAPALRLTQQALVQAEATGTLMQRARIERQLSAFYEATHAPGPALHHYQRHIVLRDSMRADQTQRRLLRERLTADATQREAALKATQDKARAVDAAEISRQRVLRNASIAGALALLLVVGLLAQRVRTSQRARRVISVARETAEYERDRADALLLNILPADTAAELKATGRAQARHHAQVTVLFSDVVGFTQLAEQLAPEALVSALDTYFGTFDALCEEFHLEKIKTVGDAYLLAGGLNGLPVSAPAAVVRCGLAMQAAAARLATERAAVGLVAFELRIGIHTGPVVAGVVGSKKFAYDIWGDTVNTAARMEQSGAAGRVNISEVTYQLVKTAFSYTPRGRVAAKNKGEIAMYFVDAEQPASAAAAP